HEPLDLTGEGGAGEQTLRCDGGGALRAGRFGRGGEGRGIRDGYPAPAEGGDVGRDGHTVDLDGLLDGLGGDLESTELVGGAHDEEVRGRGLTEQRLGCGEGVERDGRAGRGVEAGEQVLLVGVPDG